MAGTKMHETFDVAVMLRRISCGDCGMVYALPERFIDEALKDPEIRWRCPSNTCPSTTWGYSESEADRLKRQLATAQRERDRVADQRNRLGRKLSAQKGVATRMRNRIKHGLCPCCRRTFKNLQDHMKNQHPDFGENSDD